MCIVLVDRPSLSGIAVSGARRGHLGQHRPVIRDVPAVEGPEMHPVAYLSPDRPQPGDASVRGLGHTAMAREPEDAPRRMGPHLDEPELITAAGPRRVLLSYEIDVVVRLIRRPVRAEVVEELIPVLEAVALEIGDREAEGVVDPGDEPCLR